MSTSASLNNLIRSLTMNEKRHFKIFAQRHVKGKENKYLNIFDEYNRPSNAGDDDKIKQRVSNIIPEKHFPVYKNYLYHLILKSLELFHDSTESELCSLLKQIEILFKKNLLEEADKLVKAGKQLANDYEKYPFLLKFFEWEIQIVTTMLHNEGRLDELNASLQEEHQVLKKIHNTYQYKRQNLLMLQTLYKKGNLKSGGSIYNNSLLKNHENALTFQSKLFFYRINIVFHSQNGQYSRAYEYLQNMITVLENHPEQIKDAPELYHKAIQNLIINQMYLRKYDDALKSIAKLKSTRTINRNQALFVFFATNTNELGVYNTMGDFEKSVALIKSFKKSLEDAKTNETYRLNYNTLLYAMAYANFGGGYLKEANKYLFDIINSPVQQVREDILMISRVLLLLVLFEMEKHDILKNNLKSTEIIFQSNPDQHKVELALISHFKKWIQLDSVTSKEYRVLEAEMENFKLKKDERGTLRYFLITNWLEGKISRKPFSEVIRLDFLRKK